MTVGQFPIDGPAAVDGVWLKALAGGTNRLAKNRIAGAYDGLQPDATPMPARIEVLQFDFNDATGPIASIEMIHQGQLYTTATATVAGGDGTAVLTPTIAAIVQGAVLGAMVTAPGEDYTTATATITTTTGSGATLTPIIVGGEIVDIEVTAPGSGYAATDTVTVAGDGTGATATLSVGSSGGEITGITVATAGTKYMPQDPITISGDGSGAQAQLVITTDPMSAQLPIADEPGTILLLVNASPNELQVFPNERANRVTNTLDTLNGELTTAVSVPSQSLAWFAYAEAGRWVGGPPAAAATTATPAAAPAAA